MKNPKPWGWREGEGVTYTYCYSFNFIVTFFIFTLILYARKKKEEGLLVHSNFIPKFMKNVWCEKSVGGGKAPLPPPPF